MTYRDLMRIEHPNAIDPAYIGGCMSCPSLQGYEKHPSPNCAVTIGKPTDTQCRKCWDREAPDEIAESVLLAHGLDASEYIKKGR